MEDKNYSNEMRGTLWMLAKDERRERGPIATGTLTISGVELRVAMWPSAKVAKPGSKADGKTYMSLRVEYKQGADRFLAAVSPASVRVTDAAASTAPAASAAPADEVADDDPMPF